MLANHILAQEVRASVTTDPLLPTLSDFLEPRWWQQCFEAAANPQSGKRDLRHVTSARLFSDGNDIRLGGAGKHAIETLSKDIITNIHVMLILNFHKQLPNAFKQEILSYSTTRNFVFDTADREKLVDYCICGGASNRAVCGRR